MVAPPIVYSSSRWFYINVIKYVLTSEYLFWALKEDVIREDTLDLANDPSGPMHI